MKTRYSIILLALLGIALTSCNNEEKDIFDKSAAERLNEAAANYTKIMSDDGGKWQFEYFSNSEEQGYVYVCTFKPDGSVVMGTQNKWATLADGADMRTPRYTSMLSLWQVITDNGPVLSFNTYNKYFHVFADPENIPDATEEDPDETGYGHEGDYEFDIMDYRNDTLFLVGKKYGIKMHMTRMNPDVDDQTHLAETYAMSNNMFSSKIQQVYMNLPDGTRYIVKGAASQLPSFYKEGEDEITTAVVHNIIITATGMSLMTPLIIDGKKYQNFDLQDDGSLLCREDRKTTINAGQINTLVLTPTFNWAINTTDMGGDFVPILEQMTSELTAYNKSKLNSMNINATRKTDEAGEYYYVYNLQMTMAVGTRRVTITISGDGQANDDGTIEYNFTEQADNNTKVYMQRVPSIATFVDAVNAKKFKIEPNSILAPTNNKLIDTANSANYLIISM